MIEVKRLTKAFDSNKVLDELDLTIRTGETMVIIGRSGCGKSVLLKHIMGLMKPDSGTVVVDGQEIHALTGRALDQFRLRCGMLFQSAALFDSMTVFENVTYGPRRQGINDKKKLMEMIQRRVGDQNLLRIIGKWLHVGVMEEGRLLNPEMGVYQGSVISPILANLYLHVVLDEWVEHTVKPRMKGEVTLFRFCDDFIVCFQYKGDAEKFYGVLPKRFERYGLTLHSEKTRLIEFGRFSEDSVPRKQGGGCH